VQVIVYAGAIVVLFLFVIMLLGVDNAENLSVEPIVGQRTAAAVVSLAVLAVIAVPVARAAQISTGAQSVTGALDGEDPNVVLLGRALFTDYVFAFEATGALLVIAVVGAVVLARRPRAKVDPADAPTAGRS
jgi:NADH-quinone oxidoreductase subunit J